MVVCVGPWSTCSWALYRVINMDLLDSFTWKHHFYILRAGIFGIFTEPLTFFFHILLPDGHLEFCLCYFWQLYLDCVIISIHFGRFSCMWSPDYLSNGLVFNFLSLYILLYAPLLNPNPTLLTCFQVKWCEGYLLISKLI